MTFHLTPVIGRFLLYLVLINIIISGNRSFCRLDNYKSDPQSSFINSTRSSELRKESLRIAFKDLFTSADNLRTSSISSKLLIIPTTARSVHIKTQENQLKVSTELHDTISVSVPESSLSNDVDSSQKSPETEKVSRLEPTLVTTTVQEEATQSVMKSITPSSSHDEPSVVKTPAAPANDTVPETREASNQTSEPDKVPAPDTEAMPSFDEWKRKKQAELGDGEKVLPAPGAHTPGGTLTGGAGTNVGIPANPSASAGKKPVVNQKRRRNYSSFECGAKVVASNRESEGAGRILNEQMDEYMLNPCRAKIWFIIELCDKIQATQLELANYELFSSLPKEFAVSTSDQYPTRDWTPLGTFVAQDQRALHTFPLMQQGYGKFLKVELLSHYGREHYCPLSVVRVFGTSMVDEFEDLESTEQAPSMASDEDDRPVIPSNTQTDSPNNIFGNAKKVVLTFISKAAQALGRENVDMPSEAEASPDSNLSILQTTQKAELFPEPARNLTVPEGPRLFENHSLSELHRLAIRCGFCISTSPAVQSTMCRFMWAVFNGSGIHSLCLRAACQTDDGKTNATRTARKRQAGSSSSVLEKEAAPVSISESTKFASTGYTGTVSLDSSRETVEHTVSDVNASDASQHLKTETLSSVTVTLPESSSASTEQNEAVLQPSIVEPSLISTDAVVPTTINFFPDSGLANETLEDVTSDMPATSEEEYRGTTRTEQIGVPVTSTQKESVFVRLNNRIRLLEVNLSLSSQYLQELSQRYRRQMEDMQRAFNRTIAALNQTAVRAAEQDRQQQAALASLQKQVEQITGTVDRLRTRNKTLYKEVLETHLFLIVVEAIVVITVLTLCWRRFRLRRDSTAPLVEGMVTDLDEGPASTLGVLRTPLKRHHSVCELPTLFDEPKKRRPSEMVSTAGTYSDLMIVEPAIPIYIEQPHRARRRHRNRKSKSNLARSISNPNISCIPEASYVVQVPHGRSPISNPAAGVLFLPSATPEVTENCENCVPSRTEEAANQKVPFQNLTNPRVRAEDGACKEHFSLRKLLKMNSKKATV